jgi:hypothetical protein
MTELKVGMAGTVNGKPCVIKSMDVDGPLSHLMLVQFSEGRDCLRTIERPDGRVAYVSKKSFLWEVA